MKRLWFILLLVSCTIAQKINYTGEINDEGKWHGKGVITYSDGEKWEGEFKDGVPYNGYGTQTITNGAKYIGELKDGKYNGKGVCFKVNGEITSGVWNNNTLQAQWTIEAVENFLKDKYPQFKGLNYSAPSKPSLWDKFSRDIKKFDQEYTQRLIDRGLMENPGSKAPDTPLSVKSMPKDQRENRDGGVLNDIIQIPPPPETLTNIAVVDFNGNNISDGEVNALTDRLRAELFKTKHFKVIEREMMQEVLKEQGFQQSGCTTDKCMVRIGRLVGVEKIIGGSISKVGNVYSVSSRIVNVETGEVEKSEIYDHMGDIGQLLTNGMKQVAIGLTK